VSEALSSGEGWVRLQKRGLGEVSNFGSSPLGRLSGAQLLNYTNAESRKLTAKN